jgi:HPt (histidine-containing phosphotransfer) domain-containing protein
MTTIFDREGALKRMGNDEQLFREMAQFFLEDSPRWMSEVQRAMERSDLSKVRHAAHSLKGLAANFGADTAVRAAAEVEQDVREGRTANLADDITRLQSALDDLSVALAKLTQPSSRPQQRHVTEASGSSAAGRAQATRHEPLS